MVHRIACLVIFGLILSGGTAMAGGSGKEAAAVSAAEKWLATVDAGNMPQFGRRPLRSSGMP